MARRSKATPKKRSGSKATPKPATRSRQGVAIPDEVVAQVWVLTEEGVSVRKIAKQLGIAVASVGRIRAREPERLGALVSAQREERAHGWIEAHDVSLNVLVEIMAEVRNILFTKDGKRRARQLTARQAEFLELARPWMGHARLAADVAGRQAGRLHDAMTHALTPAGGDAASTAATELSEEQLIEQAKELGIVEMLPAALRERVNDHAARE